jgi:hypothetical protein
MVKTNIGFTDRQEAVLEEAWVLVSKRLLDDGWVTRASDECDDDFQDRLWEATGQYMSTHHAL